MKYCGTLISVSDMTRARNFYEQVMEQKVMLDLGVHVSFENAFCSSPIMKSWSA